MALTIPDAVKQFTALPVWQEGDQAQRHELVRGFALHSANTGLPEEQRGPLLDALYEEAGARGFWGTVGFAVKEAAKSVPAGAGALVGGVSDAAGITEGGSGQRITEGLQDLGDSAVQRVKSLHPDDWQEFRDQALSDFKSDIDRGAYPPGLVGFLSGAPATTPEEQKAQAEGEKWFTGWSEVLLRSSELADKGDGADKDEAALRIARTNNRGMWDRGRSQDLLADYMATRDPGSWAALETLAGETEMQWQQRHSKQRESLQYENFNPRENLLDDLSLRAADFQRSPIDMAMTAFPLMRGAKALQAARGGRTAQAIRETAQSAAGEFASGAASEALSQSGRASTGAVVESGGMEALGGGTLTAGAAATGAAVRGVQNRFAGAPDESDPGVSPAASAPPLPGKPAPSPTEGPVNAAPASPAAPAVAAGPPAGPVTRLPGLLDALLPEEDGGQTISNDGNGVQGEPATGPDTPHATPAAGILATPGRSDAPPIPDTAATVAEQARLAADPKSTRKAVLITPGTPRPPKTAGLVAFQGDTNGHGIVLYNPRKITPKQVRDAVQGKVFDARVLGFSETASETETGDAIVTASLPGAPNVQAEVVATPEALPAATEAAAAAAPGATVEVKTPQQVLAERQGGATGAARTGAPSQPDPVTQAGSRPEAGQPGTGGGIETTAPRPAVIVKPKGKSFFRIPENITGARDVVDFLQENRVRRFPRRQKNRDGTPMKRGGEFDALVRLHSDMPAYYAAISRDSGTPVDVLAQMAADEGLISDPSPDALIDAFRAAVRNRRKSAADLRAAENNSREQEAAARRQAERQEAAFDKATEQGPIRASGGDLAIEDVGTVIEVEGIPLTVIEVTPEGVMLEDGERFGTQWLPHSEIIHIDKVTPAPAPRMEQTNPAAEPVALDPYREDFLAGTNDDPFNLVAETAEDRRKREARELREEQARAAREAEAARAEAEKAQGTLFGEPAGAKSKLEAWADRTIAEGKGRLHTGLDPELLAAYAVRGAYLIGRGVKDFATWSAKMLAQFGDAIRPHLRKIYDEAERLGTEPRLDDPAPVLPVRPEYDTNRFGLRVQADERIRASWRATFTPALYKTFGFEQLVQRVNAWIGENGGLEGGAALFMDDASGLADYERNALGQVVAQGLETRARRAVASGDAQAVHDAEAAFDTVIERLEQLGTQAGQALASFRLWGGVSPRGTVRAIERQTAQQRGEDFTKTFGGTETPEGVQATVEGIANTERAEREARTRDVAQRWIQRLATVQSDTLSWRNARTLSELEKLIRAHMKQAMPDFSAQAQALGVDTRSADVLDALVNEDHRRRAGINREAAADQLIARLTAAARGSKAKSKVPAFVKTLMDAAENGALDRAGFLDAYAKHYDKPRFTPEFAAAIRKQVETVQATPENSWLRQKEQSKLMAMLARHEGIPAGKIWTGFWYANILSGVGTHLVNTVGTATHLLAKSVQLMATQPQRLLPFVRGMLAGAQQGVRQGWAAFSRGEPVMRGDEEWQLQDVLEMIWDDNPQTWGRKLAKYGAASWGRYVFRALTAADSFFWNTAKEGRAWLDMSRKLDAGKPLKQMAGLDADTYTAAQEQAAAEFLRMGQRTPATRDVDRRAFEIVEAQRAADVTHRARKWGAEVTYNYEPEGTMGAVAKALNGLIGDVPVFRAFVPFVRILANLTDKNLDWTPVGLARAAKGGHLLNSKGERFTAQERIERIVSGAVGTLGLFALYSAARGLKDEDDEDVPFMIYGSGPTDPARRAQMPDGWKRNSIKIGDTYVSYESTPLAYVLGVVGTALDNERYGSKLDRSDTSARALALLTAGPKTVLNSGVLSSLNQTFEMIEGKRKPGSWAARIAGGFVPAVSLQRDIATALDPVMTSNESFWSSIAANLPVLRGEQQPLLNDFGEPVKVPGPWLISRIVRTNERPDPQAVWLTRNGLHIPGLDRDIAVGQYLNKSDKPAAAGGLKGNRAFRAEILERIGNSYLTPQERTAFLRESGPAIRKVVSLLQTRRAPVEQRDLNTAVQTVRRRAMLQLIK